MKGPLDVSRLRRDLVFRDNLLGHELEFHTTWGLFSPKAIDDGSRLLLEHLQVMPDDQALDLGCGYGPLGLAIASSAPAGHCTLVDKDFVAVEYARRNAARNGISNVEVLLSNGLEQIPPDRRFNLVVTNLPAKTSKEHYYIFFHDVRERLLPGGRFYVVVISGLRDFIKRAFIEVFGNHEKLKQGRAYTVALARRD